MWSKRASLRPLPRRCCSVTWPIFFTTAMRRWPSAAPRRSPSIRISCASCSARPICASCSTPTPSPRWKRPRSASRRTIAPARPTESTISACASAISRAKNWPGAWLRPDLLDACRPPRPLAPPARAAHCRRAPPGCRRRCGPLPRWRWGFRLPPGLAAALLEPVAHPVLELVRRYARTHGPFTLREAADRFALDAAAVENALRQLAARGPRARRRIPSRRPSSRMVRRRNPAPDSPQIAGQAAPRSRAGRAAHAGPLPHALAGPARAAPQRHANLDALLDAIESLQGAPLPASLLETSILPARIADYAPAGLDTLIAAGEVAWAGVEPIGERDGRIALFLADKLPLARAAAAAGRTAHRARREAAGRARIHRRQLLRSAASGRRRRLSRRNHRCFVEPGLARPHHQRLAPCPARLHRPAGECAHAAPPANRSTSFRSRRTTPPTAQGRWSLLPLRNSRARAGDDSQRPNRRPKPVTPSPCNCSTATACCCANRSPRRMFPAASAPSTTCSKLSKKAAAFAAATLSPDLAPRSLRFPPPSICCASCAPRRRRRSRSLCSWPPPILPTPTARSCAGPICPSPKKILNPRRAFSLAPPMLK